MHFLQVSVIHLGLSSSHYDVLKIFHEIADVVVLMFVDFSVFDIVMSKGSNESEGELCDETNKVVVASN